MVSKRNVFWRSIQPVRRQTSGVASDVLRRPHVLEKGLESSLTITGIPAVAPPVSPEEEALILFPGCSPLPGCRRRGLLPSPRTRPARRAAQPRQGPCGLLAGSRAGQALARQRGWRVGLSIAAWGRPARRGCGPRAFALPLRMETILAGPGRPCSSGEPPRGEARNTLPPKTSSFYWLVYHWNCPIGCSQST
jgi:hypothetical protein